ncbi:hypothetical protein VNO77_31384 [Canavalia gladiata]|uniref:Uncharacterized protein n=1 Tax=Canavalia gladiata TaxID=3824 RepID=A0AAN9KQB1_CANGL
MAWHWLEACDLHMMGQREHFTKSVADGARTQGPEGSAVGSQPLAPLYLCIIIPLFIYVSIGTASFSSPLVRPTLLSLCKQITLGYHISGCGSYPPTPKTLSRYGVAPKRVTEGRAMGVLDADMRCIVVKPSSGHGDLGTLGCHGKLPPPTLSQGCALGDVLHSRPSSGSERLHGVLVTLHGVGYLANQHLRRSGAVFDSIEARVVGLLKTEFL